MTRDVIPEMYAASLRTPFFWIDDVFITGVLAGKVKNVEYVDLLRNFSMKLDTVYNEYTRDTKPVKILFTHLSSEQHFYDIWNATLNRLTASDLALLDDHVIEKYPYLKNRIKQEPSVGR